MKKKDLLVVLLLFAGIVSANAQMRIGGGDTAHTSAMLDLNATDAANNASKGLALPRVTTLPAVARTVKGLTVYNTTDNKVYYSTGTAWVTNATAATSSDFALLLINAARISNNCEDSILGVATPEENWYKVGDFGPAGCWTVQNLKDSIVSGDPDTWIKWSAKVTDNTVKAYCLPGHTAGNLEQADTLGLLYTWAAATGRTGVSLAEGYPDENQKVQGICPDGWHIPSDIEATELELVIALSEAGKYSSDGPTYWDSGVNYTTNSWRPNASSTRSWGTKMKSPFSVTSNAAAGTANLITADTDKLKRGFNVQMTGYVTNGKSTNYGAYGYFWTSSNANDTQAWCRYFRYNYGSVARSSNYGTKTFLYSVRCKKD